VAKGFFITLEGGEGAGKTSQARMLGAALEDKGYNVLLTREPGGTAGAEAIRKLLVEGPGVSWDGITEALLHTAARRDHLVNAVWPALEAGKIVISDRFVDSTIAYQGYAYGVDCAVLTTLYKSAIGDFMPYLSKTALRVPRSVQAKKSVTNAWALSFTSVYARASRKSPKPIPRATKLSTERKA
jgi:dTMP kinase